VEDRRLLTGRGTYVDDVRLPGMVHACFVRSPFARARIVSIDTSAARAVAGVVAVLTGKDINAGVHEQWHSLLGPASPETPRPPLADTEVRFVGDPVALVIATDRYIAEDASELVDVDYEALPPVVDYTTAERSAELVHTEYGSNLIGRLSGPPEAAVEEAFSSAAYIVSDTIYQQAQSAVPIETRGLVVQYVHGDVTIWAATQAPHEVRAFCARLLGIPENRVRVIMKDTGGGFGQVMVQRTRCASCWLPSWWMRR
jgi:aerobic carbon-monoxide dehydrogenase large subunit